MEVFECSYNSGLVCSSFNRKTGKPVCYLLHEYSCGTLDFEFCINVPSDVIKKLQDDMRKECPKMKTWIE